MCKILSGTVGLVKSGIWLTIHNEWWNYSPALIDQGTLFQTNLDMVVVKKLFVYFMELFALDADRERRPARRRRDPIQSRNWNALAPPSLIVGLKKSLRINRLDLAALGTRKRVTRVCLAVPGWSEWSLNIGHLRNRFFPRGSSRGTVPKAVLFDAYEVS